MIVVYDYNNQTTTKQQDSFFKVTKTEEKKPVYLFSAQPNQLGWVDPLYYIVFHKGD